MDVTSGDKTVTNIDDILIKFKVFSRYFTKCWIFIFLSLASSSISDNHYVFTAVDVSYRCADARFGEDSCAALSNSTDVCTEWVYEDPHSFVAELACQKWKRTLVGSMHSLGMMIGLIVVGPISDRLGRNKTIALFGTIYAILGIAKSFATYYWIFIALEFAQAAFAMFSSPCYLLSVELVAHDRRILYGMTCNFGYATGFLILPLAAWSVPNWRHFSLVIYSPVLLSILYIFLMDECPRWLLSKGRKDEAVTILQKMVKCDKIELDINDLENLSVEDNKTEAVKFTQLLKDTFISKVLLKRLIICVVWWMACTFVNYGLQINSVSLQGNKYVNFSYMSLTEILGSISVGYFATRFRRKIPLVCCFFFAAILCTCQVFTPRDFPWLSILLFMSGKVMAVMFFKLTYLYTSEIFPTYTRNSMHALCSSLGRIGSIIAPQTPLLVPYWKGFPALICGMVSLVAGLVTLLAPDTGSEILPDTVFQAEALEEHKTMPKLKNYEHKF